MTQQTVSSGGGTVTYCCTPSIVWLRDKDAVFLVDPEQDRSWSIKGTDAAIWDWLTLGHCCERTAILLSLILRISEDEARQVICETLHRWQGMGIVIGTEAGRRGQPGD